MRTEQYSMTYNTYPIINAIISENRRVAFQREKCSRCDEYMLV